MIVLRRLLLVLLACVLAVPVRAEGVISSQAIGIYAPGDEALLVPAFVDAVNRYLRRYEPRLVAKEAGQARMQALYDYRYDIDFTAADGSYQITVTLAQKVFRKAKAQKIAAHLVGGIERQMDKNLLQRTRLRGATNGVAAGP